MKLKKLLQGFAAQDVKGPKDIDITGLSSNSKLVVPGNLFVAKKGYTDDGHRYIPEAVMAGATAILTSIYDPLIKGVTQVICPDIDAAEAALTAQYYQWPSKELLMVGITGTNGKTTCAFLAKHLLDAISWSSGLIGTVKYIIGQQDYEAARTTPDVITNHKLLREMLNAHCKAAVMEVSSHALDQRRVRHIEYDFTIFTNLSQDHLDYHVTMEEYLKTKALLFSEQTPTTKASVGIPKKAFLNADSPTYDTLSCCCQVPIITYGIDNPADIQAKELVFSATGTTFQVCYRGEAVTMHSPLVGRFNVYNMLTTFCLGIGLGLSLQEIAPIMSEVKAPPGRLERVKNPINLQIYVDYAVTEDSLDQALKSLHEFKKGRIITVFGCGGNRDKGKRPKMAAAAQRWSTLTIVTNDNPRKEDPEQICRDVLAGFSQGANYVVELDRYSAIKRAIDIATPDDIVLIAGKGHETYQIFSHKTIEFDDRQVALQACQERIKMPKDVLDPITSSCTRPKSP